MVENLLVHLLAGGRAHARVDQDAASVFETDGAVEIGKDLNAGAHGWEWRRGKVYVWGRELNEEREGRNECEE